MENYSRPLGGASDVHKLCSVDCAGVLEYLRRRGECVPVREMTADMPFLSRNTLNARLRWLAARGLVRKLVTRGPSADGALRRQAYWYLNDATSP